MASSCATAHHAMTRPAASTLVPHLMQYVVSPDNLTCAEYCFRVPVNFNQKLKDDQGVTHLKQILTALLNTSGGIIEIRSQDGKQPPERTLDEWKRNLKTTLATFIPAQTIMNCLNIPGVYPLILHVAKSDQLITIRSGLFVRGFADTTQVSDTHSIRDIQSHTSQQPIANPLAVNQNWKYGDIVTTPEGPNVEYKYWGEAKDLEAIKKKLHDARTSKTLFALPNMPQGGYFVIGVQEDKTSGSNTIKGQIISDDEEEKLSKFLETHFQQDSSGQPRLWGDGNRELVRGRDWMIEFIEVQNGPSQERRRVILIEFQHFPGGVFEQLPETFSVAENGKVHSMSLVSWRQAVMDSHSSLAPQNRQNPRGTQSKVPHSTTNTQGSSNSESRDPMANTSRAGPSRKVPKQSGGRDDEALKVRDSLSWSRHGSNWNEPLEQTSLDLKRNADKLANRSRLFKMSSPINFTPNKETLFNVSGSNSDDIRNAVIHMEKIHARSKAFGIASSTWPLILKTEDTIQKPSGHLLDVFAVDENGRILLWAIVDNTTCKINTIWKYLYLSGRTTKRNLLCNQQFKTEIIRSIQVEARVYILGRGEEKPTMILTPLFPVPNHQVTGITICLATSILEKETKIRTIFGDEHSFILTAQQIETILQSGFERFNHIEGPPGSGKTYMAIFLCKQYDNYGYICTTEAFKNFLILQGLQSNCIFVIKNDRDLTKLVDQVSRMSITHLIFDDFQQTQFQKSSWKKLFKYISRANCSRLVVFGDSRYHNYQHSKNKLSDYMYRFCGKNNLHLNQRVLSEVHRNTRKVTTFIKSMFVETSEFPDHQLISCSNTEIGDDVEVRRFSHMLATGGENDFISFIRHLIDPMKVMECQPGSYEAKDVVILLDTKNVDSDIKRLRGIATQQLENIDIHDASEFPVTGLTIDSLDNFVGMDRRVCILVSKKKIQRSHSSTGHSIMNPRYRAFVASRGIAKVVFAVEDSLTTSLTEALNFGELNLGVKELWHLEKGKWITDLCYIAVDGTLAILYISLRDSRICVVSTDGEPLSVSVDSPGVSDPDCTASSRDGRRVVITGWDRCGVYEVRPGRLARVNTFTMNTEVWSVSWMRDDDVIVLLGDDHPRDVARVSTTDGRVLWRLDSSVTHLRKGRRLSVNPRTDAILVSDTDCVRELSDQGQHIRDISLSSGVDPFALCVDSSGRLMFLGDGDFDEESPRWRDIYLHNTSLGHTTTVIKAPGLVYNTRLHEDRYLGVATYGGIVMYDVSALF